MTVLTHRRGVARSRVGAELRARSQVESSLGAARAEVRRRAIALRAPQRPPRALARTSTCTSTQPRAPAAPRARRTSRTTCRRRRPRPRRAPCRLLSTPRSTRRPRRVRGRQQAGGGSPRRVDGSARAAQPQRQRCVADLLTLQCTPVPSLGAGTFLRTLLAIVKNARTRVSDRDYGMFPESAPMSPESRVRPDAGLVSAALARGADERTARSHRANTYHSAGLASGVGSATVLLLSRPAVAQSFLVPPFPSDVYLLDARHPKGEGVAQVSSHPCW